MCVDEGLSYFFIEIFFSIDKEIKVPKTFEVSKVLLQEAMPLKKKTKLSQRKKRAASQSYNFAIKQQYEHNIQTHKTSKRSALSPPKPERVDP